MIYDEISDSKIIDDCENIVVKYVDKKDTYGTNLI